MATLVIDLETIGLDWVSLPEATKSSLTKWIDNSHDSFDVKEQKRQTVQDKLSLSPLTGQIVSLSMYDIERDLGAVYFVSETIGESYTNDSFSFKQRSEKEILEDFWDGARGYDTFVTFNGRAFTWPFLYHRAVIEGVRPSIDISRQRQVVSQKLPYHVDLLDEFTFYGAMRPRPSLQVLADAYDVEYKPNCGGEDVAEFFHQKKFRHIADKNASDVLAIKNLFEIWKQCLAPRTWINTLAQF